MNIKPEVGGLEVSPEYIPIPKAPKKLINPIPYFIISFILRIGFPDESRGNSILSCNLFKNTLSKDFNSSLI